MSIRILVVSAAIFNFKILCTDVKFASLQADERYNERYSSTEPAVELDLKEDISLQLMNLLHGLFDSGDMWYKSLDLHNREDLIMIATMVDPVICLNLEYSKRLIGMNSSYVDDSLRAGNAKLK